MATHSSVLAWRIPRTGGAWWAAVYGVTQSRTRLKRLSRSSSSSMHMYCGKELTIFNVYFGFGYPGKHYHIIMGLKLQSWLSEF